MFFDSPPLPSRKSPGERTGSPVLIIIVHDYLLLLYIIIYYYYYYYHIPNLRPSPKTWGRGSPHYQGNIICIHTYLYTYMYIYIYIYVFTYLYIYMSVLSLIV